MAGDQLVDPLLDRPRAHHLVHLDDPRLADAVGAVRRLILDGRVPPAVEVEDVVGGRQVEPEAAGAQRHDEHPRVAARLLEPVDDLLAGRPRRRPVEVEPLDLELVLDVPRKKAAHDRVLGEHERRVALGERLGEHLCEPVELARPAGQRARLPHRVERVVAHLLQPGDEGEHVAAPLDPGGAADVGHHGVDGRLVEGCLLDGERAELGRILPRRQVGEHVGIDLSPAKQEGLGHPDERLLGVGLGSALDRRCDQPAKTGARAEQTGVQDVHDRPQVVQPVLDRRAGQGDTMPGRHLPGGLRGVGERVLDRLRLVEHEHAP